ncbi:hypothetical protein RvY_05111-2 [Ramazzottius varieornatus]|uniref:Uncharacterized protein n=1 Tax=Ramazzottius varieornatus TaxID=947166 RepID=A0A1D1UXH7_RAMVA|nr:hypothetical protein RvY_05111-2 [Ramazzottius varieornatus]
MNRREGASKVRASVTVEPLIIATAPPEGVQVWHSMFTFRRSVRLMRESGLRKTGRPPHVTDFYPSAPTPNVCVADAGRPCVLLRAYRCGKPLTGRTSALGPDH